MPKKTKRQKILAEYRRKLKQLKLASSNQLTIKTIPQPLLNPIVSFQEKSSSLKLEYDQALLQFTISDLKKTFLITFLILVLEFLVFYVHF